MNVEQHHRECVEAADRGVWPSTEVDLAVAPIAPIAVARRASCNRGLAADACSEASEPNRDRGQHDEEAGLAIHGHKLSRGLV